MEIICSNNKLKKICTNLKYAVKKYGSNLGQALVKLIIFIENADNLNDVARLPQYKLHMLRNNRDNQISIVILNSSKYRLIIYPLDNNEIYFNNLFLMKCIKIKILEVSEHYE